MFLWGKPWLENPVKLPTSVDNYCVYWSIKVCKINKLIYYYIYLRFLWIDAFIIHILPFRFIFLFLFSAFLLYPFSHECCSSNISSALVSQVSREGHVHVCACVHTCVLEKFRLLCFWTSLLQMISTSAGCNYGVIYFPSQAASLWRMRGWCHYLRNGSEVSPPHHCPPPHIQYNYYLLKISPLLSAEWCSTSVWGKAWRN